MNADPIAWLACATLAYLLVIDLRSRETLRYGASVAMRVLGAVGILMVAISFAVMLIVCVVAGMVVAMVRDDSPWSAP